MNDISLAIHTVCLGNYNLDIPENFDVQILSAHLNGFSITTLGNMEKKALQQLVETRKTDLQAGVTDASGEQTKLRWMRLVKGASLIAYDVVIDIPSIDLGTYEVEAYVRRDNTAFHLAGTVSIENEATELAALAGVISGLYSGDGLGFCFDGGRYRGLLPWQGVNAFIHNPAVEGFGYTVSIEDGTAAPSAIEDPAATASLQARPRKIAGQPGYEVRAVTNTSDTQESDTLIAFFASAGQPAEQGQAYTVITIDMFKIANNVNAPPYDLDTAVAIWETALSSLRRR